MNRSDIIKKLAIKYADILLNETKEIADEQGLAAGFININNEMLDAFEHHLSTEQPVEADAGHKLECSECKHWYEYNFCADCGRKISPA